MKFQDIKEVEAELKRFEKKLKAFYDAQFEVGQNMHSDKGRIRPNLKQNGALRRAALDLKDVLTKITNGTNY